jgi:peptidoglycan/LPS O-acetylase OafA/YrhL
MALYSETTPFPGLAALAPVLATVAAIRHTAVHNGWLKRGLSLGFLVEVGRMSYSLYL